MEISIGWNDFKTFVIQRSLSIQCITIDSIYYLWAIDGFAQVSSKIIISDPASEDQLDFETNFKDQSNKSITTQVVTQFEKRDKTLKLSHAEGDITEDGTVTLLLKIPGIPGSEDGRWISSGMAFFDIHTPGDKILGVYFTDEDNITEQGVGTIIGSYTDDDVDEINRGWAIPPSGWVKAESIGGYGFAPAGFFIKIIAKKAGESPSGKFYCNFEFGKND